MAPFEELQELWQRQPELPTAQFADVTRSLRAYGRRQNWINAAKTAVVGAIITFALLRVGSSPTRVAGVLVAAAAAAMLLARDWRNQRAIARGDFSAPSAGFVNQTIDRLLAMRDIRRAHYWPFMGAFVLAENLVLMGTHRVWLRIGASVLPFAAFEAGLWVRRRRFDYECGQLVEQLRAAKSALEDRE